MKKALTRNRVEMTMVFTFLAMWFGGEIIFHTLLEQYYFQFYPVIAIIFLGFTVVINVCIRRWEPKLYGGRITHAQAFRNFMIGKMVKLFICLVIMLCYLKFIGEQRNSFMICFMIYYLVFLVLETLAQYNFELRYKQRMETLKETESTNR